MAVGSGETRVTVRWDTDVRSPLRFIVPRDPMSQKAQPLVELFASEQVFAQVFAQPQGCFTSQQPRLEIPLARGPRQQHAANRLLFRPDPSTEPRCSLRRDLPPRLYRTVVRRLDHPHRSRVARQDAPRSISSEVAGEPLHGADRSIVVGQLDCIDGKADPRYELVQVTVTVDAISVPDRAKWHMCVQEVDRDGIQIEGDRIGALELTAVPSRVRSHNGTSSQRNGSASSPLQLVSAPGSRQGHERPASIALTHAARG